MVTTFAVIISKNSNTVLSRAPTMIGHYMTIKQHILIISNSLCTSMNISETSPIQASVAPTAEEITLM